MTEQEFKLTLNLIPESAFTDFEMQWMEQYSPGLALLLANTERHVMTWADENKLIWEETPGMEHFYAALKAEFVDMVRALGVYKDNTERPLLVYDFVNACRSVFSFSKQYGLDLNAVKNISNPFKIGNAKNTILSMGYNHFKVLSNLEAFSAAIADSAPTENAALKTKIAELLGPVREQLYDIITEDEEFSGILGDIGFGDKRIISKFTPSVSSLDSIFSEVNELIDAAITNAFQSSEELMNRVDSIVDAYIADYDVGIRQEFTTINSSYESLNTSLQTSITRIGAAESALVQEQQSRADGIQAVNERVDATISRLDTTDAAIVTEANTRAEQNLATVDSITQLTGRVAGAEGAIATESGLRVEGDRVEAENRALAIANLKNESETFASALVTQERNARVSELQSVAEDISVLYTLQDGNEVAISTVQTAINGPNGLSTQWAVKSDVNGYITGLGLSTESKYGVPTTKFIVVADEFALVNPGVNGGLPTLPFYVGSESGLFELNNQIKQNWSSIIGNNRPADNATRNVFRGDWTTATAYVVGDIVMKDGNGWSCLQNHTSSGANLPPTAGTGNTYWTAYTVKGTDGVSAISFIVPNDSHTIPAASDGSTLVGAYVGSGTTIEVFEGTTALTAVSTITANGQFTIGTPTQSPAATITVGNKTYAGTVATVAPHSAMVNGTDSVVITYPITARRANGTNVELSCSQTITKSKAGIKGDPGLNGSNAKAAFLAASSQVFQISKLGITTPTSITLTATGQNVSGSPTFTVTSGTVGLSGTGTTRTINSAGMTTDAATVKITWDGQEDYITIVKVREGADGSNGADGADGISTTAVLTRGSNSIEQATGTSKSVAIIAANLFRGITVETSGVTYKFYEDNGTTQITNLMPTKYGIKTTAIGNAPIATTSDIGVNLPAANEWSSHNSLVIHESAINSTGTFRVEAKDSGGIVHQAYFTVNDVSDPYAVTILSSAGDKIQNSSGSTTLIPLVYYGSEQVSSLTGWQFVWTLYNRAGKRGAFVDSTTTNASTGREILANTGGATATVSHSGSGMGLVAGRIVKCILPNGEDRYYEVASSSGTSITLRAPTTNSWLDYPVLSINEIVGGRLFACVDQGGQQTTNGATAITVSSNEIDMRCRISCDAIRP